MSAAVLREAAALMRARAEAARDAWGPEGWTAREMGWDDRQGTTYDVHSGMELVAATGCEKLADHIASWHPAVALAVADWLIETAEDADMPGVLDLDADPDHPALAAARAYLGRDAP